MEKRLKHLLERIDEKTLQHVSEPRRKLVELLKGVYDRLDGEK